MARFNTQVDWDTGAAILLVALLTLMMLTGLVGVLLVRRQGAGAPEPGGRA